MTYRLFTVYENSTIRELPLAPVMREPIRDKSNIYSNYQSLYKGPKYGRATNCFILSRAANLRGYDSPSFFWCVVYHPLGIPTLMGNPIWLVSAFVALFLIVG